MIGEIFGGLAGSLLSKIGSGSGKVAEIDASQGNMTPPSLMSKIGSGLTDVTGGALKQGLTSGLGQRIANASAGVPQPGDYAGQGKALRDKFPGVTPWELAGSSAASGPGGQDPIKSEFALQKQQLKSNEKIAQIQADAQKYSADQALAGQGGAEAAKDVKQTQADVNRANLPVLEAAVGKTRAESILIQQKTVSEILRGDYLVAQTAASDAATEKTKVDTELSKQKTLTEKGKLDVMRSQVLQAMSQVGLNNVLGFKAANEVALIVSRVKLIEQQARLTGNNATLAGLQVLFESMKTEYFPLLVRQHVKNEKFKTTLGGISLSMDAEDGDWSDAFFSWLFALSSTAGVGGIGFAGARAGAFGVRGIWSGITRKLRKAPQVKDVPAGHAGSKLSSGPTFTQSERTRHAMDQMKIDFNKSKSPKKFRPPADGKSRPGLR